MASSWNSTRVRLKRRLDAIEEDYEDTNTKMYEKWLNSTPNATRRQLLELLRRSNINELYIAYKYEGFCLGKSQLSDQGKLYNTYQSVYYYMAL